MRELWGWRVMRDGPWWVAERDGVTRRTTTLSEMRRALREM